MLTIPLYCLVFCESDAHLRHFPAHEIVGYQAVCQQLVGEVRDDLSSIVLGEIRHRLMLKLSLGERVVINTHGINQEQRQQLCHIAANQGATVMNLVGKELSSELKYVHRLNGNLENYIQSDDWEGITVIGDVHGDLERLEQALAWAKSRNHFVVVLGDVIDCGPHSLSSVTRIQRAVMHGEAAFVLGNHERKIARWLDRNAVRLSEGNRVTVRAYDRLKASEKQHWSGQFRSLLAHTTLIHQLSNKITFVHAAVHPSFWSKASDARLIEQYALYGESEQIDGRFTQTHRWIDAVPLDHIVFAGHEMRAKFPLVTIGAKGGRVVFLDTGCGKGGMLASADIRLSKGPRLECFHTY